MAKATKSARVVKVSVAGRFGPKGGEVVMKLTPQSKLKATPAGVVTSVAIKGKRIKVRKAPKARNFRPLAS